MEILNQRNFLIQLSYNFRNILVITHHFPQELMTVFFEYYKIIIGQIATIQKR